MSESNSLEVRVAAARTLSHRARRYPRSATAYLDPFFQLQGAATAASGYQLSVETSSAIKSARPKGTGFVLLHVDLPLHQLRGQECGDTGHAWKSHRYRPRHNQLGRSGHGRWPADR